MCTVRAHRITTLHIQYEQIWALNWREKEPLVLFFGVFRRRLRFRNNNYIYIYFAFCVLLSARVVVCCCCCCCYRLFQPCTQYSRNAEIFTFFREDFLCACFVIIGKMRERITHEWNGNERNRKNHTEKHITTESSEAFCMERRRHIQQKIHILELNALRSLYIQPTDWQQLLAKTTCVLNRTSSGQQESEYNTNKNGRVRAPDANVNSDSSEFQWANHRSCTLFDREILLALTHTRAVARVLRIQTMTRLEKQTSEREGETNVRERESEEQALGRERTLK